MSFPYINAYQQFFDSSGAPLENGTIEFRDPTTNVLINTYPTADDADAQTNANNNPLTLNNFGAAPSGLFLEDVVQRMLHTMMLGVLLLYRIWLLRRRMRLELLPQILSTHRAMSEDTEL
jgi:hypothetical protein